MVCPLLLHASHLLFIVTFNDDKDCSQSENSFISANHVDVPLSLRHLEPWPLPFPAGYILSACLYYRTLSLILPVQTHAVLTKQHHLECFVTCFVERVRQSAQSAGSMGCIRGFTSSLSQRVLQCCPCSLPPFLSPFELSCQIEEEKTPKYRSVMWLSALQFFYLKLSVRFYLCTGPVGAYRIE